MPGIYAMPRQPRRARLSGDGAEVRGWLAGVLFVALAASGGASRADEPLTWLAPLAGVFVLAGCCWPMAFGGLAQRPGIAGFALMCVMLPVLQLVPLPPGVWAMMPGHGLYAEVARASDTVMWRPASVSPDLTFDTILMMIPAGAALMVTLMLDRRGLSRMAQWMVGIAAASALLALMQAALGGDVGRLYRLTSVGFPVGLMANRNHQAVLLAMALPVAVCLAAQAAGARRAVYGVATGFMALALVLSGSRMGLLLGVIAGGFAVMCWRASGLRVWPRAIGARLGLLGGVALTGGIVAVLLWRTGTIARIGATDAASELRAQSLATLIEAARAFLPFGSGIGSFNPVYRAFEPDALLSTIYLNEAHCEPVQLAIEGGIPALALLAIFVVWWVRRAARAWPEQGRSQPLALALTGATVMPMLSSLVDYPLRTPLLSALFVMGCVALARMTDARDAG